MGFPVFFPHILEREAEAPAPPGDRHMFITPFTRLTKLDPSDASRLGTKEAERQAALLRVPGQAEQGGPRHDDLLSRPYQPAKPLVCNDAD